MIDINLCKNGINLNKIIAIRQSWKHGDFFSYLERKRPNNGLMIIMTGGVSFSYPDGSFIKAVAGDVVYIPKGISYRANLLSEENENIRGEDFLINFILTDDEGNEFTLSDKITKVYENKTGKPSEISERMVKCYGKNRLLKLKSLGYKLLDEIFSLNIMGDIMTVDEGIEYIREEFNESPSVPEIARRCAKSESSFRRHFKEKTKMSPGKFINMLKAERAKELLTRSEITIEEVSELLCFYDKSYFYKVFKEHTGKTPLEYRKK